VFVARAAARAPDKPGLGNTRDTHEFRLPKPGFAGGPDSVILVYVLYIFEVEFPTAIATPSGAAPRAAPQRDAGPLA